MTEEQSIDIEQERNFVRRLNPMRFLYDPAVPLSELDEAKWVARCFEVPLIDIQEDKALNVSKELKGFVGYNQKVFPRNNKEEQIEDKIHLKKSLIDYTDEEFKKSSEAMFIKVYEVFAPHQERKT